MKLLISQLFQLKFAMQAPPIEKWQLILKEVVGWSISWSINLVKWAKIAISELIRLAVGMEVLIAIKYENRCKSMKIHCWPTGPHS